MKRMQLCSLLLAGALLFGALPVVDAAAVDTEEEALSIEVVDDAVEETEIEEVTASEEETDTSEAEEEAAESAEDWADELAAIPDDAEAQDPERYQALQQREKNTTPLAEDDDGIMLLSTSRSYKSFLTGYRYTITSSKTIYDGLDVSKWDGNIDWKKVKKAGVDFAIIRVGYRGYGNGTLYMDEYFTQNIKNAIAAGVGVGVYIYSQAISGKEAREEAKYCINRVKGYRLTLPIVMDVEYAEDSSGYTGRMYKANLSKTKLTNMCLAFADECKDAGYDAMIYANSMMLKNHMNASTISKQCDIWMANFTTTTSYTGHYDYWQYSETGHVSGIDYPVDCNFGFGINLPLTTKVTLNKSTLSIAYGGSAKLKATIKPSNTIEKTSWSSSRTSVASVSSGTVKTKKVGITTIKAKSGSKSDSCTVTVRPRLTKIQKAERVGTNARLSWNKRVEADHYRIYRSTSKNGTFKYVGKTTSTSFTDTTTKKGTTYYYRVRAVGVQGSTLIYSKNATPVRLRIPKSA
ncbi:MAG: GH25 family lysozyme [Butyricicoccus sp.]